MTGKVEDKKLEEYENENYYLLWWSDKWHLPYNYVYIYVCMHACSVHTFIEAFFTGLFSHNILKLHQLTIREMKINQPCFISNSFLKSTRVRYFFKVFE